MKLTEKASDTLYEGVKCEADKEAWLRTHEGLNAKQRMTHIKKMDRAIEKYALAVDKSKAMQAYDNSYGFHASCIAGVDEAGRGPLAGPVVAAAVIMPADSKVIGIDDSKKLTEAMRESLYLEILESCIAYGVGIVDHDEIDAINILEATKKAMAIALQQVEPEVILIDAVQLKGQSKPVHGIIKGDEQSFAIAAASIIAKVTRDRLMMEYDGLYPEYGFGKHKGYGTKQHYAALDQFGPSPIHRKSFLRKWSEALENNR